MDAPRFDAFSRQVAGVLSRRSLLYALSVVASAVAATLGWSPEAVGAKKGKRKKKRNRNKKLKRNAFGCVPVGKPCRGKDKLCCSGICKGKKPKKGQRDRSRCVGHGGSTCQAGQSELFCGGEDVDCTTSANEPGFCDTTTGNAPYCLHHGECFACRKDEECREFCGPDAACIRCADGCAEFGGTACVGPQGCDFPSQE